MSPVDSRCYSLSVTLRRVISSVLPSRDHEVAKRPVKNQKQVELVGSIAKQVHVAVGQQIHLDAIREFRNACETGIQPVFVNLLKRSQAEWMHGREVMQGRKKTHKLPETQQGEAS